MADVADGLQLDLHAGHQTVKHNSSFSYSDWKIGLTRNFGLFAGTVAVIGTSADNYVGPSPDARNLGRSALLLSVSKVF